MLSIANRRRTDGKFWDWPSTSPLPCASFYSVFRWSSPWALPDWAVPTWGDHWATLPVACRLPWCSGATGVSCTVKWGKSPRKTSSCGRLCADQPSLLLGILWVRAGYRHDVVHQKYLWKTEIG